MTAILQSGIMEFNSDSATLRAPKQEHAVQNCSQQATTAAWGIQHTTNSHKRRLSNASSSEALQSESEEHFPLPVKIKVEPKDDYELAAEECAARGVKSALPQQAEPNSIQERWKYEDMTPAVGHCKQCVINEARHVDVDSISLHRRRQIREFEQGSEEPLSKKIRDWKEKRLEKSHVGRGFPKGRMEEDALYQRTDQSEQQDGPRDVQYIQSRSSSVEESYSVHQRNGSRGAHRVISHDGLRDHIMDPHEIPREHIVIPYDESREHHVMTSEDRVISPDEHQVSPREHRGMTSPREHVVSDDHQVTASNRTGSGSEEETSNEGGERNFGYIRYLLTHNGGEQTIVSGENEAGMQGKSPSISQGTQPITMVQSAPSMPVVLTSPGVVPQEYINGMGAFSRLPLPHMQSAAAKASRAARKRARHHTTGSNFLERLGKGRHDSPTMVTNKNKPGKKSFEKGADDGMYLDDLNRGQFGAGSSIVQHIDTTQDVQDSEEQYISDIQRPYCNIPDDHQVTHINGVMSLPATRETRYGITLGELKRRTGFPEYLTRVDLIAYVRQSKSAGRALLDRYNISTAGQKSRPTILSKMCENEARVLGDGICRMNSEYFPCKALAKVASSKVIEDKDREGKVEQKLRAIQNTRMMLKEMYDVMVENKDIGCMKTFEVASHTFGTANILNHLTIFDRLFAEYQNNLIVDTGEKL